MKRITLLGSTGSIGTQTLDIVAEYPEKFQIVGMTAGGEYRSTCQTNSSVSTRNCRDRKSK